MTAPPVNARREWALVRRRTPFTVEAPRALEIDVLLLLDVGHPGRGRGRLLRAAARFHRLAPWTVADDSQVLRVDAPSLGKRNACVCIIGALGEGFGPGSGGAVSPAPTRSGAGATATMRPRRQKPMMDLAEAKRILAAFESEGVEYVLVGSMAMAAQGLIRATRDLDFFVSSTPDNIAQFDLAEED